MPLALAERAGLIEPSATLAMACRGEATEGPGAGDPRLRPRRARFRYAREHPGSRLQGDPVGQDPLHPPRRHPRASAGRRRPLLEHHGLPTEMADRSSISNGAKHSIHNALMAVCGPGDEVIIPAPYWVSYADLVKLTGATPVVIATTEAAGFKLTPEQFLAAVTPRTKLLMINSPSNPTGVVYDRDELAALGRRRPPDRCRASSPTRSTSNSPMATPARPASPHSARSSGDRTITISGVSKTYAMTGWRIGWSVAPRPVSKFMGDLQSQETSNPCSVSQWAALEAITGPQDSVAAMKAQFARRRDYVLERISELPGRDLHSARRGLLRLHECLEPFRPDPRRQEGRRFDLVLHGGPGVRAGGPGHGLGVRCRRVRPDVVRDRPRHDRKGFRRPRTLSRKLSRAPADKRTWRGPSRVARSRLSFRRQAG